MQIEKTTNHLTSGIKLGYTDLELIRDQEKEVGYLVYSGKSIKSGEVHHIRALNSNLAKENVNKAMTIFLRETLRLCALNTQIIIQETLEFDENKLCYAVKPVTSPVLGTLLSNIDLPRMIESLVEDLARLSLFSQDFQIRGARIYQIDGTLLESSPDIQYFVQDWNQVLWTSQTILSTKEKDPGVATTKMTTEREKENVCHMALGMLEIAGMDREGMEFLLKSGGKLYEKNVKIWVEKFLEKVPKMEAVQIYANLLVVMLDESPEKRPSIEMIREILSSIRFPKLL